MAGCCILSVPAALALEVGQAESWQGQARHACAEHHAVDTELGCGAGADCHCPGRAGRPPTVDQARCCVVGRLADGGHLVLGSGAASQRYQAAAHQLSGSR